jgi:hypothetical protein
VVWNSILDIRHCLGSCLSLQLLQHRRLIRRRCSWREGGVVPAPPPPPPPPPPPTYPPCSSPACTTPPCWPSITCCSSGRSLPFRRLSHQQAEEVPEKWRIYRRRRRRWTHRRPRMTAVAEGAAAEANCWLVVSVPGWRKTRPSHDLGTSLRHRRPQAFSPPYLHILQGLCRCQCHLCCQASTRPCLCGTGLAALG